VHEGPLGKFTSLGQTGSLLQQKLDNFTYNVRRPMTGYLYHIFFGKGFWFLEQGNYYFVQYFFAITKTTKMESMGRLFFQVFPAKNLVDNAYRVFSR